jgi:hypothetical protein
MRVAGDGNIGDRGGQSAPGPEIMRFDGFEEERVAFLRRPGNTGDGRHAPGVVEVSTDNARTGASSVRITVCEGDVEPKGDDNQTERAELESRRHAFVGRDVWGKNGLRPEWHSVKRYFLSNSRLRASRRGSVR